MPGRVAPAGRERRTRRVESCAVVGEGGVTSARTKKVMLAEVWPAGMRRVPEVPRTSPGEVPRAGREKSTKTSWSVAAGMETGREAVVSWGVWLRTLGVVAFSPAARWRTGRALAGAVSSSVMVTVPVGVRMAAAVGLERTTEKVSAPSTRASARIGILMVLVVWPAEKVKVPETLRKSTPAVAAPKKPGLAAVV